MVDLGSLIGGMIVGHLGDKYQLRALFLSPLLFLGSIIMVVVSQTLNDYSLPYYFLMFLIGNFTGGPYNVIGSAIAVDLGQQPILKGTKKSVSVISALVEGSAAIFSAVSQILIPLIDLNLMFVVFCLESLVATFTLLPLFIKDLKIFRKRSREGTLLNHSHNE